MRKILLLAALLSLLTLSVSAQEIDIADYQAAFQAFADDVAESLPFNASIGLGWSSAYIGQFPHFGIGLTAGATTLPYEAVQAVFDALTLTLPDELESLESIGLPFPAVALDARLGGIGLPFDLGFKVGFLPDKAKLLLPFPLDYLMIGGDVRLPLLKGKGLLPAISVGVGYTYLRGGITMEDVFGGDKDVDISAVMGDADNTDYLRFTSPDVGFNWQAQVVEARVQVSKSLIIITPYLGAGLSYGFSKAGGGLATAVQYSNDGGPSGTFHDITPAEIAAIEDAFAGASGYEVPDLTASGFLFDSAANGLAVRAYGGLSLNILLLKLDLSGGYNFTSGSYSLAANVRIQL
jgi:hypothetical protein